MKAKQAPQLNQRKEKIPPEDLFSFSAAGKYGLARRSQNNALLPLSASGGAVNDRKQLLKNTQRRFQTGVKEKAAGRAAGPSAQGRAARMAQGGESPAGCQVSLDTHI